MGWKFWKRNNNDKDQTTIKVGTSTGGVAREIYVQAQTADKAFELYQKLDKEA